jgi:hypothetical protein
MRLVVVIILNIFLSVVFMFTVQLLSRRCLLNGYDLLLYRVVHTLALDVFIIRQWLPFLVIHSVIFSRVALQADLVRHIISLIVLRIWLPAFLI